MSIHRDVSASVFSSQGNNPEIYDTLTPQNIQWELGWKRMTYTTVILLLGPLSSLFVGVDFLPNYVNSFLLIIDKLNQQQNHDTNGSALSISFTNLQRQQQQNNNKRIRGLERSSQWRCIGETCSRNTSTLHMVGQGTVKWRSFGALLGKHGTRLWNLN